MATKEPVVDVIISDDANPTVLWTNGDKKSVERAMAAYKESYDACGVAQRSRAAYYPAWTNDFRNIDTNVNAKSPFSHEDYYHYRPNEQIPCRIDQIVQACDMAYQKVGIVRNVVDLMADFACQGISIVHPQAEKQAFFRAWFDMVNGRDRSERFLNLLYRLGNVVIARELGRVRKPDLDKIKKGKVQGAKQDFVDLGPDRPIYKNEIPLSYNFMDVCGIEVVGSELAALAGEPPRMGLKISSKLRNTILSPKTQAEKEMVAKLDSEFVKNLKKYDQKIIPLDPTLVSAYYYKKDDWRDWATPMLYSILDNLVTLEKMRLADLAALDGAISNIRLWKLGKSELGIAPNKAALTRLSNMLTNNPGGGTLDLIWTDDIELVESKTNVHQFLGETKYAPVWQAIFQGLGIPATLAGAPNASGTTNNFIAMKTLVERLEYGRMILQSFWQKELKYLNDACGFKTRPPQVHFEKMSLSDEVAEKALLLQMVDRNLISDETFQQMTGFVPSIEKARTRKEQAERKEGRRVRKASQWHNPEPEHEYKKIALQAGYITPEQLELELEPLPSGKKTPFDTQVEANKQKMAQKKTGIPGQGRPRNKKDSKQRKRTVKPRTSATQIQVWASDMQTRIAELVIPKFLGAVGKKNLRQLSADEFDELELRKFSVLSGLAPFSEVTDEQLMESFDMINPQVDAQVYNIYEKSVANIKSPTVANQRQLQVIAYTKAQRRKDG